MKAIIVSLAIAFSGIVTYAAPANADTVCYYDKQGQFYCNR